MTTMETPATADVASPVQRILLGGTPCDLVEQPELLGLVRGALRDGGPPLLLASANLDHIHHFGSGGAHAGFFERSAHGRSWLVLLDGMPHVHQARRATGREWPPLAGAELLPELLTIAEQMGVRAGVLGGTAEAHEKLRALVAQDWPRLELAGTWLAGPHELGDPVRRRRLAEDVRAARVDLLAVCLGKPRQELWLDELASASGVRVGACFGGALNCLVGEADRAPRTIQSLGLEWAWRLAAEPRRLWRRYLVQGPAAYWRLRHEPDHAAAGRVTPLASR